MQGMLKLPPLSVAYSLYLVVILSTVSTWVKNNKLNDDSVSTELDVEDMLPYYTLHKRPCTSRNTGLIVIVSAVVVCLTIDVFFYLSLNCC